MPDLYEVLQISVNADADVIDLVFRHLIGRFGYGRHAAADSDELCMIGLAYHVLSDPDRRAAYDRWLFAEDDDDAVAIVELNGVRGASRLPWQRDQMIDGRSTRD